MLNLTIDKIFCFIGPHYFESWTPSATFNPSPLIVKSPPPHIVGTVLEVLQPF